MIPETHGHKQRAGCSEGESESENAATAFESRYVERLSVSRAKEIKAEWHSLHALLIDAASVWCRDGLTSALALESDGSRD